MESLNVLKYGYLGWRSFRSILRNIKQFFRNFKSAWQRITKGYCDQDLWNLDVFYLQLFIDTLEAFPKGLHGAPLAFFDEENDSIDRWLDYLKEMRQHFCNAQEADDFTEDDYKIKEFDTAWEMMNAVFFNLWD